MITLCSGPLADMAPSFTGCRIQTLVACYGMLPNALDCYHNGQEATICRFGDTVMVSGIMDIYELFTFGEFLGIQKIEWESDVNILQGLVSSQWSISHYPLLSYVGEKADLSGNICIPDSLRRSFELLCESDEQFAREAEYLPWLSDITSRRVKNRAGVYLLENDATACITAKGNGCACLSSVAVASDRRGQKLGQTLVSAVCAAHAGAGNQVFTAAQSDKLVKFYKKCGFVPLQRRLCVAKRR